MPAGALLMRHWSPSLTKVKGSETVSAFASW